MFTVLDDMLPSTKMSLYVIGDTSLKFFIVLFEIYFLISDPDLHGKHENWNGNRESKNSQEQVNEFTKFGEITIDKISADVLANMDDETPDSQT